MYLRTIQVKNFRLLADASLDLSRTSTVVVGRNNSGKTSLGEIVRRLVENEGRVDFRLEDFSTTSYEGFVEAFRKYNNGAAGADVRDTLPAIEMRLKFHYEVNEPALGALGQFIVDLNPECTEALVVLHYGLADGAVDSFFDGAPAGELNAEERKHFFRLMRERVPKYYQARLWAEDPNDPGNRKDLDRSNLRALLKTTCISAQRGLDDVTSKENDILSKVLEDLFAIASRDGARDGDKDIVEALKSAVEDIQQGIEQRFSGELKRLLPTLKSFGYPGLGGPELSTETTLDVERLLRNNTKVRYEGLDGISMPESYNGLGVRNLIYVLLRIVSFYRDFVASDVRPGVQLVFIEEPEAHLHPQMQEVFIKQLTKISEILVEGDSEPEVWPVQFVVSTHSSHIANAAGFESIRYFLPKWRDEEKRVRHTVIKDLSAGFGSARPEDVHFLRQYLTLTRCDLFFADKAILIEGTTERLMLPAIVEKIEDKTPNGPKLSSQYVTIMEVGGAYAHLFFDLLNFLELPALIITDLDAVEKAGGNACAVHEATASSNACLNKWFATPADPSPSPLEMISKGELDKTRDVWRIAFQVPEEENGPCGRSFEDAFMLANRDKFSLEGHDVLTLERAASERAATVKKSAFALRYAIEERDWIPPRYLVDGLRWLAERGVEEMEHSEIMEVAAASEGYETQVGVETSG